MENTEIKLPEWYSKDLTVSEMAEKSNMSHQGVRYVLEYYSLPYKKKSKVNSVKIPSWYNPELTVNQMAKAGNVSEQTVRYYLRRGKLPYKSGLQYAKNMKNLDRIMENNSVNLNEYIKLPNWYSPELSILEMAEKSDFTVDLIKAALIVFKLKHK